MVASLILLIQGDKCFNNGHLKPKMGPRQREILNYLVSGSPGLTCNRKGFSALSTYSQTSKQRNQQRVCLINGEKRVHSLAYFEGGEKALLFYPLQAEKSGTY